MKRAKPGWYPQDDGSQRYWDGRSWTSQSQPPPPADLSPAWHSDGPALSRWWNGAGWVDAWISNDGTFDVLRGVGQRVVKAAVFGGLDQAIERELLAQLDGYPPAKIVELVVYQASLGVPATNAVAVVEWQRPTS